MKHLILVLLCVILLLAACGDDDSTGPDDQFCCNITLKNANGEPLEGYTIVPASIPAPIVSGRASTHIRLNFSTEGSAPRDVDMVILDCLDNPVDTLMQGELEAGMHTFVWTRPDLQTGAYQIHTVLSEDGSVDRESTTLAYHLSFNPEDDGPQNTNAQGKASFTDITLFSGLVCDGVVDMRDETACNLGEVNIGAETWLYVVLQGEYEWDMRWAKVNMTDGANSFDLVWDDLETDIPQAIEWPDDTPGTNDRDTFLSVVTYPNPFN